MDKKIKLGISRCLLGERVRYDGNHKLDLFLRDELGVFVEWISFCPEVDCGLSVPREAMDLMGTSDNPQLITVNSKNNLTDQMQVWIDKALIELGECDLSGFVFKTKSPSCALRDAKLFTNNGAFYDKVAGLFARAFTKKFPTIPVVDEVDIHNPVLRNNFIERVLVCTKF